MKNVLLKHHLHLLHGSSRNRQVYGQILGFEAMLEGFPGKFDDVSKKCGFDIREVLCEIDLLLNFIFCIF